MSVDLFNGLLGGDGVAGFVDGGDVPLIRLGVLRSAMPHVGSRRQGHRRFYRSPASSGELWARVHVCSNRRRVRREPSPRSGARCCHAMVRKLIGRLRDSILVISDRSDGIPSIEELTQMRREPKRHVHVLEGRAYQYALSTKRDTNEVLLIATDG